MEEENNIPTPYTKYCVLSASEYFALNNEISLAKGYALGDDTSRYSSMNPELCKTNIQVVDEVETFDLACVMTVTVETQELFPELELVDKYVSADMNLTNIKVEGQTTEQLDYLLNHYNAVGDKSIDLIQSDAERSIDSDVSVDILVSDGLTIISKDHE